MNYLIILYILGSVLKLEGVFLLFPGFVSLIYREDRPYSFFVVAIVCFMLGSFLTGKKPKNQLYFAKEGLVIVALSWIVISIFGALPFVINGDIPNFIDALFEIVSGFTTTGASILNAVEDLNHSSIFWRSLSHWIGGMGVLVLLLAILPMAGGYNMHLMRAESPGPSVGKLVPRIKETAKILYIMYIGMTLIQIILLLLAKMPVFDAVTISFGTAGTGGFGIKNDSIAGYNNTIQIITTIFMILFGVNFNAYYILFLGKHKKDLVNQEEVRNYFLIILFAIVIIAFNILPMYDDFATALRLSAFQVGSIITTTGYSTADFDLWPQLSRTVLVMLMFIGACAGSTGGGIKVSRIMILIKTVKRDLKHYIHPRSVEAIRLDNRVMDIETVRAVSAFLVTYVLIYVASLFILAFDEFDLVSNFTAVAATINNIGPGLSKVGPMSNFSIFSPLSKLVLIFDMLAGRLELYPMLILFMPQIWKIKKNK